MSKSENNQNPGEGDREAARRFNAQEEQFTQSETGEKAIREGIHSSEAEA